MDPDHQEETYPFLCDWDAMLERYYATKTLSSERRELLMRTLHVVRCVLLTVFQDRLFSAEPFGSFINGFGADTSDLDICVVFFDQPTEKHDEQRALSETAEALRSHSRFADVTSILHARVPIIRFRTTDGVDGDLSFGNTLAVQNTRLMACYNRISDRKLAHLVLWLKRWAKDSGLGNAATRSLSSYAWTLMLVAFLQRHGCLPYLQQMNKTAEKLIDHRWDVYFFDGPVDASFKRAFSRPGELLIRFFEYYLQFDFESFVVQIRTPDDVTVAQMPHRSQTTICVQDPFDLDFNTAARVNSTVFEHLLLQMKTTYESLASGDLVRRFARFRSEPPGIGRSGARQLEFAEFCLNQLACDRPDHREKSARMRLINITNISQDTTREDVCRFLEYFGSVEHLRLPVDLADRQKHYGRACAQFHSSAVARRVCEGRSFVLNGKTIYCKPG